MLWLMLACAPTDPCADSPDGDGDGLSDCVEAQEGSDPAAWDSDLDGFSDGEELDCGGDPLDASVTCYACGWSRADSSALSATGADIGDTVADIGLVDQCGEQTSLYDFSGQWRIVFATAAWCSACLSEASGLEQAGAEFQAQTGIDFSYMILLFSSVTGDPPNDQTAVDYAPNVGDPAIPVFADPERAWLEASPYDGSELPGKCLLSPDMELVQCWTGHDNDQDALDTILSIESAR
ncbi:MAG: redoxin domain-containing protein [Myxococcota bacterium]|nr:redoxin domain-containing protein [Myxococcota bacterium]